MIAISKKGMGTSLVSLALAAQTFAAQVPGFDLTLINLRALLLLAFRAKAYELSGPDWLAETRVSLQTLDATRITMTELAAVLMDVTGQGERQSPA
jgi:hypothetical protein